MFRFSFLNQFFSAVFFSALSLSVTAQTLSSSEIAEFRVQLLKAQDVDLKLEAREECYSNKDIALQADSNQLQEIAGGLHYQMHTLTSDFERAKFEVNEYSNLYKIALTERCDLVNKMRETEWEIQEKEKEIAECKSTFGFIGFLCDFAGEIVGLNGDLRNLTALRHELDNRIASRENQLREAGHEKYQAEERLRNNQLESEKNSANLTLTEEKIRAIKTLLSEVRALKQSYATLRDRLTAALAEFEGLASATPDRQSVVRRLRRDSEELNALLVKAKELLNSNGLPLPDGERICTN